MIYPLSNYHYITPLMLVLNVALVVALMILGSYDVATLWFNWVVTGFLTLGIWHIVARFRLQGGTDVRAFAISWPLLCLTFNFAYCYLPHPDILYKSEIQVVALLAVITLMMSLWQQRQAILLHLLLGIIIGVTSTIIPHVLLWLFLIPISSYYMRSWSTRNILSAITGVLLGIWFVYFILFFNAGCDSADGLISNYLVILQDDDYSVLLGGLGFWQYLFLSFTVLLVLAYSFSGLLMGISQNIRASSSIQLISTLSIVLVMLLLIDVRHLTNYIGMLSLLLSLQLTIHQANTHSLTNEWWTIIIILIGLALSLFPLLVPFA